MFKQCAHCLNTKPVAEFGKNKNSRDGLSSYCLACARAVYSDWYKANAGKKKAAERARYKRGSS